MGTKKHRAVIVGAGRIGAGWNWDDDGYTHAGAFKACADRVDLLGFVELDPIRGKAAFDKWGVPWATSLNYFQDFDIVSVCVQPEQQREVMERLSELPISGVWCEKPFVSRTIGVPTQVNYLRRADPFHRKLAENAGMYDRLIVYAKGDIHTRCHFEDLSRWWKVSLDYRVFDGPCSYFLVPIDHSFGGHSFFFDTGGVIPELCMEAMCENLLDAVDNGTELWSPAHVE